MSQPNLSKPSLIIKEIKDPYLQKNFQKLSDYFARQNQLQDFTFLEIVSTKAVADLKIAHGLGFIPKDLLVSKLVGPGSVTLEYPDWDSQFIYLSSTGAFRLRCFVGTYWNDKSTVTDDATQLITAAPLTISPTGAEAFVPRAPIRTVITSGSGTFIPTTGVLYLRVQIIGGGGGGAGGSNGGGGGTGGTTTFGDASLMVAGGGEGGAAAQAGNAASGGSGSSTVSNAVLVTGGGGASGYYQANQQGNMGGGGFFGGGGRSAGGIPLGNAGAGFNGGGGAGGGLNGGANGSGQSGAAGGYVDAILSGDDLLAAYPYSVGAGGAAGSAGGSGVAGGTGGAGMIIIEEHFQ